MGQLIDLRFAASILDTLIYMRRNIFHSGKPQITLIVHLVNEFNDFLPSCKPS